MIRIEGLTKQFDGDVTALSEIDLEIRRGEFVFVTGSSGAGKSSLLRLLLRQDVPSAGRILISDLLLRALGKNNVLIAQQPGSCRNRMADDDILFQA